MSTINRGEDDGAPTSSVCSLYRDIGMGDGDDDDVGNDSNNDGDNPLHHHKVGIVSHDAIRYDT